MTDRVELESKLAMLERTVDALSSEVHEQNKRLDVLQESLKTLAEQVKKGGDGEVEPHNSPPPHYGS